MGEAEAAAAVAEHLIAFWDPRMKQQILAVLQNDPEALSPIARRAIEALADETSQATEA
jgi:formate dehydrogenase subunit delta